MTQKEIYDLGIKARKSAIELDPRLEDWEIFRRTFGFFTWAKKNLLTDEDKTTFGKGFNGEHL